MERAKLSNIGRAHILADATRERWLEQAVIMLTDLFEERGHPLPPVRVACGWPGGKNQHKTMGQCWARANSASGINEIFISPLFHTGFDVLGTLVHELCHAVDDLKSGHGAEFQRIAANMGLEGKPTQCGPGAWMTYELKLIEEALGPYPHAPMKIAAPKKAKPAAKSKKFYCHECLFEFSVQESTRFAMPSFEDLTCPSCTCHVHLHPAGGE